MNREEIEKVVQLRNALSERIRGVVVDQQETVDLMLTALLSEGHILLEGVPGTAKTLLARSFAACLSLEFKRIQFTPDLMPGDVVGTNLFNFQSGEFTFVEGPVFTEMLLADEINRTPPRTQAALLEAMQEGQVTIDGETHSLPFPFIVIATQNPIDMEGTFPLPEAQLDRFMVRISLGYPTIEQEEDVVLRYQSGGDLPSQEVEVDSNQLRLMQQAVSEVRVENSIRRYIVDLVRATRVSERTKLGASPRASISLYRASQARAGLLGRDYVIPDDVKILSQPVLSHRIIPTANARLRGYSQNSIVEEVLSSIPVPIEKD